MSNIIDYVNSELEYTEYKNKIEGESLIALMKIFSDQDHSGMSASITRQLFIEYHNNIEGIPKQFFDKEEDFYGGMTGRATKELCDAFNTYPLNKDQKVIVLDMFDKVSSWKPLSALTFKDSEWGEPYSNDDSNPSSYQNRRNSSVFKEGKDGKPYYIDAHVQRDQKKTCWQGSVDSSKGKIVKCYIKDPANIPTIYLDIYSWEVNKDNDDIKEPGSGWWVSMLKDETQLDELEKYYDVEYLLTFKE